MKPAGYEAGVRYPTLLNIHGGPFTQYGNTFFDEFQVEAGGGYAVVFCNPRGSSGYSEAWGRAIRGSGATGAGVGGSGAAGRDRPAPTQVSPTRLAPAPPAPAGARSTTTTAWRSSTRPCDVSTSSTPSASV